MKTDRTRRLISAATASLALAFPIVLPAADVTWDGGGSDDLWGTGANWVGDVAPALGDNIHFAGSTRLSPSFNYTAYDNMARIYFDSGASGFTLIGNSIKLQTNGANTPLIQNDSTTLQTVRFANIAFANSGTINAASGDITMNVGSGTGSIFLDSNSTLTLQAAASKTLLIDNIIANGSGSTGNVLVAGPGTVKLARANTYTGTTGVDSGTLELGNNTAMNGTIAYVGNGGTALANTNASLLLNTSGLAVSNQIVTNKADTGSGLGTGTRRIGGNFTSGSSTFSGSIFLNGGSVLTAGSGGTVVFSGVIQNGIDTGNVSRALTVDAAGGTVTLTGNNSYTGGTTINTGSTVLVGNGGTTGKLGSGALVNNGTLTNTLVGSGTTINLGGSGNITGLTGSGASSFGAETINFSNVTGGAFTATTTGNQSYIATGTAAGKGLVFTNGGSTYNFTTTGGASITMNGDVGANSAPASGGAIVNLNTSSGNGTINLDISVGRSNQFWNIGQINANAGTGAINWTGTYGAVRGGNSSQSTPITLTGAINMTANFQVQTLLTLTLNAAGTSTVTGNLLGSINLVKGGTQNLTLSGANTYSGTTTVNTGRLIVNGASNTSGTSIASGAFVELNNNSGTRDYSNTTNFTGAGTLVKSGAGAVMWGGGSVTFNLSSGALIDVQGGTFIGGASANDVWTTNKADLNVASGAIFDGAEGSSFANGGIFVDALSGGGTIKIGYTLGGPYGNKITFGVDNGSGSFAGVLANSTTDGNFVKTGTGTQTLTGTSTATGSMTINNGTLALGHASNTLANTMPVTVDGAAAILSIAGNSDTVGVVTLKNGASITGSGGTLTGASYAVEKGSVSAILGGAVNLTKTTTDTVTLSGANTYSGSTTVSQGRLIVSNNSNTNATSVASGATLELNKASGTTSFGVTTNFTGAGTILKTGAGGVTWFGAATFNMSSGALIDVQEGTFTAADSGNEVWTNNKSDLNVATGAIFNGAEAGSVANGGIFVDSLTGGGRIEVGYSDGPSLPYANLLTFGVDNGSGTFSGVLADKEIGDPDAHGSFTKKGTGTQTLTGTSTATGTMTVNNGTLVLGHATDTLGSAMAVTVDGSAAILSIGGNSDTVGTVSLKNGGSITGSGGTLTGSSYAVQSGGVSAKLGGSGIALTKSTSGTVTLSGANTYTGATTVNAGNLIINGNQSAATGAVTVNNSGTRLMGNGTVGGATTINAGAIHAPGTSVGTQTFSSSLTYANASIFEWDLTASLDADGADGDDGVAGTDFDNVSVTGNIDVGTTGTVFKVVFGSSVLTDITTSNAFWNTPYITQVWNMATIFGEAFNSGAFQSVETSTDVSAYGSFTINGTSLTWTAVPEPTSALAGLLLGAGLLRRRRRS